MLANNSRRQNSHFDTVKAKAMKKQAKGLIGIKSLLKQILMVKYFKIKLKIKKNTLKLRN